MIRKILLLLSLSFHTDNFLHQCLTYHGFASFVVDAFFTPNNARPYYTVLNRRINTVTITSKLKQQPHNLRLLAVDSTPSCITALQSTISKEEAGLINIQDENSTSSSTFKKSSSPNSNNGNKSEDGGVNVVLVTGFESFNRDLYTEAGKLLPEECKINLKGMCLFEVSVIAPNSHALSYFICVSHP
jgi:hypothetical protein